MLYETIVHLLSRRKGQRLLFLLESAFKRVANFTVLVGLKKCSVQTLVLDLMKVAELGNRDTRNELVQKYSKL